MHIRSPRIHFTIFDVPRWRDTPKCIHLGVKRLKLLLFSLQVGHKVLRIGGPRNNLDQLPPVITPGIENGLGVVY